MSEIIRLDQFTTLKVGGKTRASFLSSPNDLHLLDENPLIIGRGSNLLISDLGVKNTLINRLRGLKCASDGFIAYSGVSLGLLVNLAISRHLGGIEWACGIPASVGGAIISNAGAFGGDMASVVEWVEVYKNGKLTRLKCGQLGFSYRKSEIDGFVVRAKIRLCKSDEKSISEKISRYKTYRLKTQPQGYSAGSVYKKVNGISAGYYIEKAGLKGRAIGDAVVSEKHANFIINRSSATASDVYRLMLLIEKEVEERFSIKLEREIKLYGEF